MIPLALLLAALPCGGLPQFQKSVADAATARGWSAALAEQKAALAPLELDPPKLDAKTGPEWLAQRVAAACAAQQLASATAAPDPARLEQILGRREFSEWHDKQAAGAGWLDRLMRHFWRWILELMGARGTQSFAEWTRTVVLLAALGVLAFAVYRLLRARKEHTPLRARNAPAEGPLILRPPEDHLAAARAALAKDPREAIRQGLFALLSSLERRRLARPDRVKTNREIVSELPSRGATPELVREIAPLVHWYDARFYSLAPVPPEGASHFIEQIAQLEARIGAAR